MRPSAPAAPWRCWPAAAWTSSWPAALAARAASLATRPCASQPSWATAARPSCAGGRPAGRTLRALPGLRGPAGGAGQPAPGRHHGRRRVRRPHRGPAPHGEPGPGDHPWVQRRIRPSPAHHHPPGRHVRLAPVAETGRGGKPGAALYTFAAACPPGEAFSSFRNPSDAATTVVDISAVRRTQDRGLRRSRHPGGHHPQGRRRCTPPEACSRRASAFAGGRAAVLESLLKPRADEARDGDVSGNRQRLKPRHVMAKSAFADSSVRRASPRRREKPEDHFGNACPIALLNSP